MLRTLLLALAMIPAGAAEPALSISSDQPGNVFLGASGVVTVTLAAGNGRAEVEDEAGAITSAELSAGTPLTLALPAPGYYRLRAEAGAERLASAALVLGRNGPLAGRELATDGFFAVRTVNPLAARAGGHWNRAFLDLTQVKTVGDDGFAWAGRCSAGGEWLTGLGLAPILADDQEWILCLGRMPDAWTTKPVPIPHEERWKFYPPRDWDRFAAMIRWMVSTLPPAVRHLEVLNEPDANWRGTDEELVRYHTVVADAVHAVRPEMRVLGPCLCSVKIDLLTRLDALGIFQRLDGLSIHPYVNGTAPEGEFIARIDALRAWNAARRRPLPIYLTEHGWQTNPKDWQLAVDEATHARYTARSQLLLAARPGIVAYQLFCLLNAGADRWDAYSLLAADGSPRPAYAYAATAMHRLAGATKARILELGCDARALVWAAEGGSRLALWSGQDAVPLRLPAPAIAAWSACGRILTPPGDAVAAGPDPLYLAIDGAGLAEAGQLAPLTVLAGSGAALPFTSVLAAASVVEPGPEGTWRVRADAPRGTWQIAGRSAAGWAVLPLTVAAPVAAVGTVAWDGAEPVWAVALDSRLAQPATVTVTLAVAGGGEPRIATALVAAGASASVRLPLDRLPWGHRLGGTLTIAVGGEAPAWTDRQRFYATIAAVSAAPPAGAPAWNHLRQMEVAAWAPFEGSGQAVPTPRSGLRARVRLAHGAEGLHLLAEVDDPVHRQDQAPAGMWSQDSLQVAFDVDTDQPWQPNSMRFWNGHRIAEYGLSLGAEGPRCWRWRAANGLPEACAEPRVTLLVERSGGTTRYRALFPWAVLGLEAPLMAGRSLGFALAVNDVGDPPADSRAGLRLFYGIVESKDATRYGRLVLLP